jgi:FkbM family methyltransferase
MFFITKRKLQQRLAPLQDKLGKVKAEQKTLRDEIKKLRRLVQKQNTTKTVPTLDNPTGVYDLVITPCEISDHHGTGVLLRRIFGKSHSLWCLRSGDFYDGRELSNARNTLYQWDSLPQKGRIAALLDCFGEAHIRRIAVVPYHKADLEMALILSEVHNAPLCIYIMDDNCLLGGGIPAALMQKALQRANLRLAISGEMRNAYETSFKKKFLVLPPVVEKKDILLKPMASGYESRTNGVIVGNIWSKDWLDSLCAVTRESGIKLDWYGNVDAPNLETSRLELMAAGITPIGFLPENELTTILIRYGFAVIPSSKLDSTEPANREAIGRFSLPSRISYLVAAHQIPIIVLGAKETCAAQFITHFNLGEVTPYDTGKFSEAVVKVNTLSRKKEITDSCFKIAHFLASDDIAEWIWESLKTGMPADDRFEKLIPRDETSLVPYLDDPIDDSIYFAEEYSILRCLKRASFNADFVIDVGCSTGVWADSIASLYPNAKIVLVDPLLKQHLALNSYYEKKNPNFAWECSAVGAQESSIKLLVTPDLYRSSLVGLNEGVEYDEVTVPLVTVDFLATKYNLSGRGILKADVQGAEHLVLEGARSTLAMIDVIMLELTLVGVLPNAKGFLEMLNHMDSLGFEYYDEAGGWRDPVEGHLLQQDVVFIRKELKNRLFSIKAETVL